ncbi:bleomycin resistance protein [Brucella melitensis 548]|nr:bleomycin resistance protein [Brucella melitensis 548]
MTSDAKQAQDFYSKVIGWTAKDAGMPGMKHTLFDALGCTIAGMMALSDLPGEGCMDARPGWLGYIGVADVDAAAEKVMAEGGKILRAAGDIPGVGRFAVAADPQGAVFSLYSPKADMEPPADFGSRKVGHPSWHELYAAMARPYSRFTRRFSAGSFRGILTWGRWENTRFSVSMAPIWGAS